MEAKNLARGHEVQRDLECLTAEWSNRDLEKQLVWIQELLQVDCGDVPWSKLGSPAP